MKIIMSVAVAFVVVLMAAEDLRAQAVIQYQRETRNSRLSVTLGGGLYYVYGGLSSPGIVWSRGRSTIVAGTNFYGYGLPILYPSGSYAYVPLYYPSGFSGYTPYSTLRWYGYGDNLTPYERAIMSLPMAPPENRPAKKSEVGELTLIRNLEEGKARIRAKEYAKAEEELREVVAGGRENPVAKFYFGLALLGQGEYAYAAKAVRRAIQGIPELRTILSLKAADLFKDEKELSSHIRALEKNGSDDARFLLGVLHLLNGEREKAHAVLERSTADKAATRLMEER